MEYLRLCKPYSLSGNSLTQLLPTKASTTFSNVYNFVPIKLYVLSQIMGLGLQAFAKSATQIQRKSWRWCNKIMFSARDPEAPHQLWLPWQASTGYALCCLETGLEEGSSWWVQEGLPTYSSEQEFHRIPGGAELSFKCRGKGGSKVTSSSPCRLPLRPAQTLVPV